MNSNFFKFRFSLRSLLVAMPLGALIFWGWSINRPHWAAIDALLRADAVVVWKDDTFEWMGRYRLDAVELVVIDQDIDKAARKSILLSLSNVQRIEGLSISTDGEMPKEVNFPHLKFLEVASISQLNSFSGSQKIEKLRISAARKFRLASVSHFSNLKDLEVQCEQLEPLAEDLQLQRLSSLRLTSKLSVNLEDLAQLQKLKSLSILNCEIENFESIWRFDKLETLRLRSIPNRSDWSSISSLKQLEVLDIRDCAFSSLHFLSELKALEALVLKSDRGELPSISFFDDTVLSDLTVYNPESLVFLEKTAALVGLNVRDYSISEADANAILKCPKLEFVSLVTCIVPESLLLKMKDEVENFERYD